MGYINSVTCCFIVPVLEHKGEVLTLSKVSRMDMGAYLCIASNGYPPIVSKRILVSVDCEYLIKRVSYIGQH